MEFAQQPPAPPDHVDQEPAVRPLPCASHRIGDPTRLLAAIKRVLKKKAKEQLAKAKQYGDKLKAKAARAAVKAAGAIRDAGAATKAAR